MSWTGNIKGSKLYKAVGDFLAKRITLAEGLSGEDGTNKWLGVNVLGYKIIRCVRFVYSSTATTEKVRNLAVEGQSFIIQNATDSIIWVGFGLSSITPPTADQSSELNMVCVGANTTISFTYNGPSGANQVRVENIATATGSVIITAMGNA